jgi:hypothetical protein
MKILRRVLLALLFSLLLGLAIGTLLRLSIGRPVTYIGSAATTRPLDIGLALASVLDPRHHEEQVREAIQVA